MAAAISLKTNDMAALLAEPSRLAGLLRAIADRIETTPPADGTRPKRHRTPSEPVQDPYLALHDLARYSGMSSALTYMLRYLYTPIHESTTAQTKTGEG